MAGSLEEHTKQDNSCQNVSQLPQDNALEPVLKIHCLPVELKAVVTYPSAAG